MELTIIKPGLLSTVQDLGRYNYLSQAVSISGAMDTLSACIANMALGNDDNAAVIEFTYADAEFKAESDLLIAYAGDGAVLMAGDNRLPTGRPLFIPKGKNITLYNNPKGSRTYLAIAGGIDVPEVLGSRSTFITAGFGGMEGRPLKAGDGLSGGELFVNNQKLIDQLSGNEISYTNWSIPMQLLLPADRRTIHVVLGNEFNWLDGKAVVEFLSEPFVIGKQSNRMGYHLEGPALNRLKKDELLSTAVMPGTIQVTGNGSLILLMADCQTTGGYPRIAQVAAVDMPLCAQLKPGDTIYFKEITQHEAEMLYLEREQQLKQLKMAVQYKFL